MEYKEKFALWMSPETKAKVDQLYKADGCRSRTEFMEKAILFYCGYLTANDYREYFPNVIVSTMKATLDSMENRMASLLFKNAVAISMMLHVVAATHNIDKESLSALEGMCVADVKRIHGTIRLQDAVKYQKG